MINISNYQDLLQDIYNKYLPFQVRRSLAILSDIIVYFKPAAYRFILTLYFKIFILCQSYMELWTNAEILISFWKGPYFYYVFVL